MRNFKLELRQQLLNSIMLFRMSQLSYVLSVAAESDQSAASSDCDRETAVCI